MRPVSVVTYCRKSGGTGPSFPASILVYSQWVIAAGHMLHHRAALTGADFQHQNQQAEPNIGTGKGGTATAGGHQAKPGQSVTTHNADC